MPRNIRFLSESMAVEASYFILITFASGCLSPICDIEPLQFRRYSLGCQSRLTMKIANKRESPRIEIKLRCHITSPALSRQSAVFTENISRSGVLIGCCGGVSTAPVPPIGPIETVEIELPSDHGFGQKCIPVALRVNYMEFRSFHDRPCALEALQPVAPSWMA
jgi:hypothetical protein